MTQSGPVSDISAPISDAAQAIAPLRFYLDAGADAAIEDAPISRFGLAGARLEMAEVSLLQNGAVVASDKHDGQTGNEDVANAYRLKRDEFIPGAKLELEAKVRTSGSTSSYGTVSVKLQE